MKENKQNWIVHQGPQTAGYAEVMNDLGNSFETHCPEHEKLATFLSMDEARDYKKRYNNILERYNPTTKKIVYSRVLPSGKVELDMTSGEYTVQGLDQFRTWEFRRFATDADLALVKTGGSFKGNNEDDTGFVIYKTPSGSIHTTLGPCEKTDLPKDMEFIEYGESLAHEEICLHRELQALSDERLQQLEKPQEDEFVWVHTNPPEKNLMTYFIFDEGDKVITTQKRMSEETFKLSFPDAKVLARCREIECVDNYMFNYLSGIKAKGKDETFMKADFSKNRVELIEPQFIEGIGHILTFGAIKYSANNWKSGGNEENVMRIRGAMMRHMLRYLDGEILDPESNLPHLAHLATNAMFLDYFDRNKLNVN